MSWTAATSGATHTSGLKLLSSSHHHIEAWRAALPPTRGRLQHYVLTSTSTPNESTAMPAQRNARLADPSLGAGFKLRTGTRVAKDSIRSTVLRIVPLLSVPRANTDTRQALPPMYAI
ncbi:hypothetical protein PsYK624_034170 [Phanerochaete sordida]|uniref:Uncharacterized protein n=1 Tax=Phanerochaete sordida TaxID=48140 RepID=A0A9P3G4A5_9APHY|nr:hypothetical protein PsYK624_034170 [Phanerochaete sordida]